jgi:hypothetical protein
MTADQPLGQILSDGDRPSLRFERHLAHPPEKVWSAITESEHLQHWLPTDIVGDRRAGATIDLPFWPAHVAKYQLDEQPLRDGSPSGSLRRSSSGSGTPTSSASSSPLRGTGRSSCSPPG